MTTVRNMTATDLSAVAALSAEASSRALLVRPHWETEADALWSLSQLRRSEFLAAEGEDGSLLGFAGYTITRNGEAELYGPLAATEGEGIGAFLMTRIEALARQAGAGSYSMLIGLNNGAGVAWAEWRGYLRDSEYPEQLYAWVRPGELRPPEPLPGVTVREMALGDLEAVAGLHQTSFPAEAVSPESLIERLEEWLVLEREGRVIGAVQVDGPGAFLHHLCVAPAERRQGLGARLAASAVTRFWQRQRVRVGISTRLENETAAAFLRGVGFRGEVAAARWVKRVD